MKLHEAFYPSELSDKHPIRIIYGFVLEEENLSLVVFYPKLTGTSTFNLLTETKTGLINFLLNLHVYDVCEAFIKVVFIAANLHAEEHEISLKRAYMCKVADQRAERRSRTVWGTIKNQFIKSENVRFNSRELSIGSTDFLDISEPKILKTDRVIFLLESLKKDDLNEFSKYLKVG